MNNKQKLFNKILDIVVNCCSTDIDGSGRQLVTREDVLGRNRSENVTMTRAILIGQMLAAGFTITSAAALLSRTPHAIRHLVDVGYDYMQTSHAYRTANDEATELRASICE